MKYFSLLILFSFLSLFAFSQQNLITISGTVYNNPEQDRVPFATVSLKDNNIHTVTDNLGFFKLTLSDDLLYDTLVISSLGYETSFFGLTTITAEQKKKFYINASTYTLPQVKVKGLKARSVVYKAIEALEHKFQDSLFVYKGFYRQLHQENNQYVRLIEADIDVLDKGVSNRNKDEIFILNEIRRSQVYEKNGEVHGNHLVDLITMNPVKHTLGTIFSKPGIRYYDFKVDSIFNLNDKATYAISFETKDKAHSQLLERGWVWVDYESFSVWFYKIETLNDRPQDAGGNDGNYNWDFIGEAYEISFKEIDGLLYPLKMKQTYNHNLIHTTFGTVDFEVIETFEFYSTGYETKSSEINKEAFKRGLDLYNRKYDYNPSFWSNYLPVHNYQLDSKAALQLGRSIPLDKQFELESENMWKN